jgi:hypothetical protein
VVVFASTQLAAQATRTWVSGVGDDANPCSRTAPCKTFAGAISKTASSGIINVIDPGGYGALTITKPITVDGTGNLASTLFSGVNGFVINITTGTNRDVVIRNISLDGTGTTLGVDGIRFIAGDSLTLEGVVIEQCSGDGIEFLPNSNARLTLINTSITQCGNGIKVAPTAGGVARVSIAKSIIHKNGTGVLMQDLNNAPIAVSINDTRITNNTVDGVFAQSTTGSGITAIVAGSEISNNAGVGLRTAGASGRIRSSSNTITGNGTGVSAAGGELCSFLNNVNTGNVANNNGSFTGTCSPALN